MKNEYLFNQSVIYRITRNTAVLAAAQILEKVCNFFLVIILVRYLSEEGFGRYGFISSYVVLFNVFIGLGFSALCTREISKKPEQAPQLLTAALVPMLFSSVLTFAVIRWSILWSKPGQTEVITAIQLATIALILNNITNLFGTIPRAREKMLYVALPRLARQLIWFLLCLLLLPSGFGLVGVFQLMLFSSLVEFGLQIYFCSSLLGVLPSRRFDPGLFRKLLKDAFPLALTSVFVIIYYKIDSVMLSYMQNDVQVGQYTAAYNLAFAFLFLGTSFHQATYPILSKLYVSCREKLHRIYKSSTKYLVISGLPMAAGIALLAPRIVVLVYGERYLDCAGALQILMGAFFLMFINGFMGNALIAAGGQKDLARIVGIGTVINVGLNLVFIPQYSFLGAACATVITELYASVFSWIYLKRNYSISTSPAVFFRPLVCCALMSVFVMFFSSWSFLFIIPSAAFIYCLLLYALRVLNSADLVILKNLVSKKDFS